MNSIQLGYFSNSLERGESLGTSGGRLGLSGN